MYTDDNDQPKQQISYTSNASGFPPPPPTTPMNMRQSAARERMKRRKVKQGGGGEWAWVIIAVALLGVVVTVSLSIALVIRGSRTTVENILPTADAEIALLPTPVDFRTSLSFVSGEKIVFEDGTEVSIQPWDGEGRITVLLLGIDRRPGEKGLSYRTDTMILMSLDPRVGEVGMLSIPRDLYIEVPGYGGMRRINEPMVLGELREPGRGPVLAMETVEYNLGIRVNHFIVVDFGAFITIVDAVGGIEVNNEYNIYDGSYPTMNYGYEVFKLAPGTHLLDGETALKFARTRHGDNDIERGKRQQEVLFALLRKVADPATWPRLLTQLPVIWNSVQENIYTDLTLEQMLELGLYVKDIPMDNINASGISYSYLSSYVTPSGAQVLIPNRVRLADLMAEVFGENYIE